MSKVILVATEKPFAKAAVDRIKQVVAKNPDFGLRLLENYTDKQDLLDAVKDVDALIIRSDKATREVLEAAKNLKVVARGGAGYDNIDCEAATENGICVMNTPGQNSNAVSELVFGMMLNLVRHQYVGKPGTELRGKSIGIHAYGNAGKCVARLGRGFGMDVFAHDPYVDKSIMEADGVKPVDSREELYSTCDFISLHIPGNDETVNSINFELLSKMKEGAALINTARKEVIDEEGLKKMFSERPDFRYGSDLTPDCKEEIYTTCGDRSFFTAKKMGAQTAEANINSGVAAITQIINFFDKGDETFRVNKKA
ncbi:MAG: 3-phosphoglycerate dehydrogenase [Deltaproteobacteria bacterium]|nr:3-phosphoglycerate dehydrogenase [Deltaproteobacteria bacterium]